jgi:hypothetical protein
VKLPAPRIVAIDDNSNDLRGLADGLNRYGAACLQVLFTGEESTINSCPHVRVIFADLHLNESGPSEEHEKHFATIGGLIEETIAPKGPYILVLWTRYPDQAEKLAAFLEVRLANAKPMAVGALDKAEHLDSDGKVKSAENLVAAIAALIDDQPQVAALINWEERVLEAAAGTVAQIVNLAVSANPAQRNTELDRILGRLAVEAVGKSHVAKDHFRAVNEALLPILYDSVASLHTITGDDELWKNAFSDSNASASMSLEEASILNRFLHIASAEPGMTPSDRGCVSILNSGYIEKFTEHFAIDRDALAKSQLACAAYVDDDDKFRWMVVKVEAACDYAQRRLGPIPFALALEAPFHPPRSTSPAALWMSPPFEIDGASRCLALNSRFVFSLTEVQASQFSLAYRIREQLLNHLLHHIHSHGSRPGFTSFRKS